VNAEKAEESEEQPSNIVIDLAFVEADIGVPVHSRNEEEINDPADEKQAQREKVEGSGDRLAIIETMGTEETEDPEEIADEGRVGRWSVHGCLSPLAVLGRKFFGMERHQGDSAFRNHFFMGIPNVKDSGLGHYDLLTLTYDFRFAF